jgi:hypothetical protein
LGQAAYLLSADISLEAKESLRCSLFRRIPLKCSLQSRQSLGRGDGNDGEKRDAAEATVNA